jgi:osmotically-inducible protein OsmY
LSYTRLRALPVTCTPSAAQTEAVITKESRVMKNDIQIQQEVLAELDHENRVPPGSVGVEVHHGVVKLAGATTDATVEETAAVAAQRVDGVTKVVLDMGIARC